MPSAMCGRYPFSDAMPDVSLRLSLVEPVQAVAIVPLLSASGNVSLTASVIGSPSSCFCVVVDITREARRALLPAGAAAFRRGGGARS